MKSTFFILLTTALLSCSHKTPESPSGDQSAPAPAKTADAASQQETGCSGELVFESQEPRAPKLVRGAGGWLVGWLDDGTVAKAMLSTQARAERCEPPFTLSDNAEALALAANGDAVVALWFEPSAGGSNGLIKGGRVGIGKTSARPLVAERHRERNGWVPACSEGATPPTQLRRCRSGLEAQRLEVEAKGIAECEQGQYQVYSTSSTSGGPRAGRTAGDSLV